MLHHSNSQPPQHGYVYLGQGWYVTTDLIGWLLADYVSFRAAERWPNQDDRPYYQHWWHRWDSFYRCQLKLPGFIDRIERRRYVPNSKEL